MNNDIQSPTEELDAPRPAPTGSDNRSETSSDTSPKKHTPRNHIQVSTEPQTPVATASPDGHITLDERALEGFIPIADVERDYIARSDVERNYLLRTDVERDYISRVEALRAEEDAFSRGREDNIRREWSDKATDEIAEIFSTRRSVWDA